jgi:cholinesterase
MLTATTGFALWLATFGSSTVSCYSDSPRWMSVKTSSGTIKGHMAAGEPNVIEYLGIPFAKPPTGALRFAPPQPLTGDGVVEASEYGLSCPSFESGPPSYPQMSPQAQDILEAFTVIKGRGAPQGEDCLNLNIWTKRRLPSSDKAKPVVVFIHGGREFSQH